MPSEETNTPPPEKDKAEHDTPKAEARREDDSPLPSDSLANHDVHVRPGASLADHEVSLADHEGPHVGQVRDKESGEWKDGPSLADYDGPHVGQVRDKESGGWKDGPSLADHDVHLQTGASLADAVQPRGGKDARPVHEAGGVPAETAHGGRDGPARPAGGPFRITVQTGGARSEKARHGQPAPAQSVRGVRYESPPNRPIRFTAARQRHFAGVAGLHMAGARAAVARLMTSPLPLR